MAVNGRKRQWEREAWERRDGGGGGVVTVVNERNRIQGFFIKRNQGFREREGNE